MDIQEKLAEIIPPTTTPYRREFSNEGLIDKLNESETIEIEKALIEKLYFTDDLLTVQTLAYMKSTKAGPAIKVFLKNLKNHLQIIITAALTYEMYHENEMIDIAIDNFKQLKSKWDLVFVFCYLKKFNDSRINDMIKSYVDHSDFLISYNAKEALGITTER